MAISTSTAQSPESTGDQICYLVEPIFIQGHKIMVAAVEGSAKTWLLTGTAIHVAAGEPLLGMEVNQCSVLMLDEETPIATLKNRLNRLASGLGYQTYEALPIVLRPKREFRFGSKSSLSEIAYPSIKAALKGSTDAKHLLITMDSHIAMLGATTHSHAENQDTAGRRLGETLENIQTFCRDKYKVTATVLLATHAKKGVTDYDIEDIKGSEMQELVRGHGSIVGLGCDTGFVLKKISDNPLRGVLIPKPRREAVPMEEIYWELQEESYGHGWAKLVRIEPVPIPPSELAVRLYSLFKNNPKRVYPSQELSRLMTMYDPSDRRLAVYHLQKHKIIVSTAEKPFDYQLTPDHVQQGEFNQEYTDQLEVAYEKGFGKNT